VAAEVARLPVVVVFVADVARRPLGDPGGDDDGDGNASATGSAAPAPLVDVARRRSALGRWLAAPSGGAEVVAGREEAARPPRVEGAAGRSPSVADSLAVEGRTLPVLPRRARGRVRTRGSVVAVAAAAVLALRPSASASGAGSAAAEAEADAAAE
jgi:hypothetical protein